MPPKYHYYCNLEMTGNAYLFLANLCAFNRIWFLPEELVFNRTVSSAVSFDLRFRAVSLIAIF